MVAPAVRPKLGRPSVQSDVQGDTGEVSPSNPDSEQNRLSNPNPPPATTSSNSKQTVNGRSQQLSHETSTSFGRSPALTANEEFQGPITGPPPQPAFARPARSTRNPNPYYVDSLSWMLTN